MNLDNNHLLLFVPLVVYALVGVIYRLFADPLSIKIKSKKVLLFVSLIFELGCMLPMFITPSFITNIIQSVGAGIGAGCISLFALMFNDNHADKQSQFTNHTLLLLLPPILAQMIASGFICVIVSMVQEMHLSVDYLDKVRFLWLVAVVFIIVCFMLVLFYKEQKIQFIQSKREKNKIQAKNKSRIDVWFVVLSFAVGLISLTKWIASGATASIQVAYISTKTGVDTRGYEGYASLVGALGEAVGVILVTLCFVKNNKRIRAGSNNWWWLLIIAAVVGIVYFVITGVWITIPMFIFSGFANGLCYGLISSMVLELILKKTIKKDSSVFSPVGIYNTSLGVGIVAGTFINCWIKSGIFDQIHGFSTFSFQEFVKVNWIINIIGIVCTLTSIGLMITYFVKNKVSISLTTTTISKRKINTKNKLV